MEKIRLKKEKISAETSEILETRNLRNLRKLLHKMKKPCLVNLLQK